MKLGLNSAPASLFTTNGDERDKLVVLGRSLMREANGRTMNKVRGNSGYTRQMTDDQYSAVNEKVRNKIMLFCANRANAQEARQEITDYQVFLSKSRDYFRNSTFLRMLAGIVEDIVRPMLPYVMSNALDELGQTVYVPLGQTYEITVMSNDIFVFQDSSWGATRSVPENTLYNAPITLNPTPRAAECTAKWYQLVGNDADFGMWLNAIYAGLYSKVMALWNKAMIDAAASNTFVPSYLKFESYNSDNFNAAVEAVSSVNHVSANQLIAYGRRGAIAKLLPTGTTQDAALTYGLGNEWMRTGYLGTVQGVPTFELLNGIVPGTQNTTGDLILNTNDVWIAARRGNGYAPVYIAFEDGTPITLELMPHQTADMTLNVNVTASMDVKAVFGSKLAVIKNVL